MKRAATRFEGFRSPDVARRIAWFQVLGPIGLPVLVWILVFGPRPCAAATPSAPGPDAVRVLEIAGRVEFSRPPATHWQAASVDLILFPGDKVRTGPDSRALLQFSDRSVFRLNQSSLLELRPRVAATGNRSLFLRLGELFFFDRERPANLDVGTPTTTSAIRGTEFHLGVDRSDGTVRLAVLEGAVAFEAGGTRVDLTSGQQATAAPGAVPEVRPILRPRALLQWCLHYPGVLVPDERGWPAADSRDFAGCLEAYREGDVLAALARLPDDRPDRGSEARLFSAGIRLAAGQVSSAESVLISANSDAPDARALRRLMAVVRGETDSAFPPPSTPAEWLAESYALQARSQLTSALAAAKTAGETAPKSGFVWIRQAELEWALGRRAEALHSLETGRSLSPRNPMGFVLAGFIELSAGRTERARRLFEEGRAIDGSLADVWLGLGLVAQREGRNEEALARFQAAAALDPERSVVRGYLGKGWAGVGDSARAATEFDRAIELDPADPTGWLYRGLERQQTHRLNESVGDLQESLVRNEGRAVFRSSLLLDQDRAMRRADLSVSYAAVGLNEVAERSASRAIEDSAADYSSHLYRARTLQDYREDPSRFDTRYEPARRSELLIANLLAPPEGANLSQQLSQQDHLRPFDGGVFHGQSETWYRSSGDWLESATLFGTAGRFGYALDGQYQSVQPDGPGRALESAAAVATMKQGVGDRDDFYVQSGWLWREGGVIERLYDPQTANPDYRFEESEEPFVHLGWHREWAPGSHSLALASFIDDRLRIDHPHDELLFLRRRNGLPSSLTIDPFFDREYESRFRVASIEVQQILEGESHALVVGARYQHGEMDAVDRLERLGSGPLPLPWVDPGYESAGGYAYYTWRPITSLRLMAGLAFDDLRFPANSDWAPISEAETHTTQWSPKIGASWSPWKDGQFRAAWTRSLGGFDFAQSQRLEPLEVAGFIQAYRNLTPSSVSSLLSGLPYDVAGVGFDQVLPSRTFLGIDAEQITTDGLQRVGVMENATAALVPDRAGSLDREVHYREETLSLYLAQLIDTRWAAGVRYSLSRVDYATRYPSLPSDLPGAAETSSDVQAILGQLQFHVSFNHESGAFAQWMSTFRHQQNVGYRESLPDDSFWQHEVWIGYRFARRLAEIRLGVVNLFDQDYRLNPLNEYRPIPRERTFEAMFRFQF